MEKSILYYCIVILLFAGACNQAGTKRLDKPNESKNLTSKYTCPMDKEISSDKPGKCSACGMDLVQASNKPKKH